MQYDVSDGLMKENSLSARIYFLLLKREMGASEVSKIIYNDEKVQLSNILKAIEKLTAKGYVKELPLTNLEKEQRGIDKRIKLYKSTYLPLLEYIGPKVLERKKASPDLHKEEVTEEDIKVLELIFKSQWFSKFYTEGFLKTQHGEISVAQNKEIYSHCPIRFFAFMLEELFDISFLLSRITDFNPTNKQIIEIGDFDKFIELNKNKIKKETLDKVKKINAKAVTGLGHYKEKTGFHYYTEDEGILLIPAPLAKKLQSIGRVPLTVHIFFNNAIEKMLRSRK